MYKEDDLSATVDITLNIELIIFLRISEKFAFYFQISFSNLSSHYIEI